MRRLYTKNNLLILFAITALSSVAVQYYYMYQENKSFKEAFSKRNSLSERIALRNKFPLIYEGEKLALIQETEKSIVSYYKNNPACAFNQKTISPTLHSWVYSCKEKNEYDVGIVLNIQSGLVIKTISASSEEALHDVYFLKPSNLIDITSKKQTNGKAVDFYYKASSTLSMLGCRYSSNDHPLISKTPEVYDGMSGAYSAPVVTDFYFTVICTYGNGTYFGKTLFVK